MTRAIRFIEARNDTWRTLGGEDGPAAYTDPAPHRLLVPEQWRAFRSRWPQGMPVGLDLANDADIAQVADDLPRLALVRLHFPKWVDGRAYSQAHLLRSRYRFTGEIRASGDVLVDMMPLLVRTGFDAVVMRADQSTEAAYRALGFFPGYYQGDAADPLPLFAKPTGTAEALVRAQDEFVHGGAAI